MTDDGFFAHVAPDGSDLKQRLVDAKYDYSAAGENLGASSGPLAAHFGIEHSPGHRKNLMTPGYTALGVGVVERSDGTIVLVEVLATPTAPIDGNPINATYAAINAQRAQRKLKPLAVAPALEVIATSHAEAAVAQNMPKVELPGVPKVHDRVFAALPDVASTSVDVYVADVASAVPASKNLTNARNTLVGVGVAKGPSGRSLVVVVYAH
ncbi:MAG: hypothetical protein JNG84_00365 [Archangium sp.]|nr:hypothetical protein [Archangium sp.]